MIITIIFGFVLALSLRLFSQSTTQENTLSVHPGRFIDKHYLDCHDAETKIGETDLDLKLANRRLNHLFV
jgi:hypothetical protein